MLLPESHMVFYTAAIPTPGTFCSIASPGGAIAFGRDTESSRQSSGVPLMAIQEITIYRALIAIHWQL